ncbi:flagellar basal body P-ring formation chaperone FlgA [Rhizobium arsenicireducens]
MRFRRMKRHLASMAAVMAATASLWVASDAAYAQGFAVVPTQTIYPGEALSATQLEEVAVTNPNLAGGYAQSIAEVDGMISKRTLLPGRTIPVASLRPPYAINRGANIRLTFTLGSMTISASGTPLSDASVGDVIRVRNLDSGVIVTGTVLADGTVQVMAK